MYFKMQFIFVEVYFKSEKVLVSVYTLDIRGLGGLVSIIFQGWTDTSTFAHT